MQSEKTKSFIERAVSIHGDKYGYSDVDYKNIYTRIKIKCNEHGLFEMSARQHLRGSGCKQCKEISYISPKRFSFEKFLSLAIENHGDEYEYCRESYNGMSRKIKIKCRYHGWFYQQAFKHANGHNCPKCAIDFGKITIFDFVARAIKIHSGRYCYEKTTFFNTRDMATIKCNIHGYFKQSVKSHLSGHGCKKCENIGFNRGKFIAKCANGRATLYLIECSGDGEIFYKAGITSTSVEERFKRLPYNYRIICEKETSPEIAWDEETKIHQHVASTHYTPKVKFYGSARECFSVLDNTVLSFFNGGLLCN